jgi:hypothetical protein
MLLVDLWVRLDFGYSRRCFLMCAFSRCTIVCYYPFALGFSRLSLTLALCGHRYSFVPCTSWGPGEDQKRFLMLPCFSNFIIWNSFQSSHTLRQPLLVIHDSKMSLSSRRSNLEVKKKSPLIGAGELKLKREALHSWVLSTLFQTLPIAQLVEQGSSGRDVSFL